MQLLTQRISVQRQVHSHTLCTHMRTHVSHTCVYTRARVPSYTKYTSTCTHIHICERTYIYTHSHTGVHVYTCRYMLPTYVRVGIHTHACTDVRAYTHTCRHRHAYTAIHTCKHARTYVDTHAHSTQHTCTHTALRTRCGCRRGHLLREVVKLGSGIGHINEAEKRSQGPLAPPTA